jgi:hypothetical protein
MGAPRESLNALNKTAAKKMAAKKYVFPQCCNDDLTTKYYHF